MSISHFTFRIHISLYHRLYNSDRPRRGDLRRRRYAPVSPPKPWRWKMDVEKDKGNGKVHSRGSSSRQALRTYKRRRQPEPEPQEQPQLQPQPEPEPQEQPQLQPQPEPEPQPQPQPQPQSELEEQQLPQPEPMTGDVMAEQVTQTYWKSRDIGWKYGIMIDENRQHWKCMYCHMTRRGGGVSRLKRHLAGDLDVKVCPKVPADVSEKIREHMREKRARRKKRVTQNNDNIMATKSTSDDRTEKDPLPVDSEGLTGVESVLEEVTNQTNHDDQEPASPKAPMSLRGVRDIGWEHAMDLDGNKRRWQCNWCSLRRCGGVTTLKAHLTRGRNSCPNIPKEISKKVSDFIEEKRAARHLFNSNAKSPFNVEFDEDLVNLSQIQDEGTLPLPDDQQSSRNATPMQTSENCTINEVAGGRNKGCAEHSGQPLDCCEQLIESSDRPEEHCTLEHGRNQVPDSNEHHIMHNGADHSEPEEILKHPKKTRFNMRKHTIMVDETAKHWRCRYCGMDGYGDKSILRFHLAGVFQHPKCPSVPKEVFAKAQHHFLSKRRPNMKRTDLQTPSRPHILGQSRKQQQNNNPEDNTPLLATNNDGSRALSSYPRRPKDDAWEHSLIQDSEKGHWKCKWCSLEGYHGITRLKWHLVGWNHRRQCQQVPEDAAKTIRDKMISREKQKTGGTDPLDGIDSRNMQDKSSSEDFDQAGRKSKTLNSWSNTTHPAQDSNNLQGLAENQTEINDCWSHWRYVLDGLMRLPGVQEGPGIRNCINDVLLYGHAEFGTVGDKVGMDSNRTMSSDGNTDKCRSVLVDVLRSDNFALLCNVLGRAVHQDGEKTRYFDFGMIDSRMKNGDYDREPILFKQDLKLLWEDLKIAGQDVIDLANSLSSLTEESYTKQVEMERGSDDSEGNLQGAEVISLEPINMVKAKTSVPSNSKGFNQLDQPDLMDVCDVETSATCNECGKGAESGSILTCNKCMLAYHISCIEAPVSSISTGGWHCKSCSTIGDESVEGAMVLAHYEPPRSERTFSERTSVGNSRAIVISSVPVPVKDVELPNLDSMGLCKICGGAEEDDKRFLICGHTHCPYKFYHIRCMNAKQIASDEQLDKPCWYCPSCLCRVCHSDKDDDLTILCDGCDEAYHLYCTMPRLTSVPEGKWYCSSCRLERSKEGVHQYEKRILKLHGRNDARPEAKDCTGFDLLLAAAKEVSGDRQLRISTD
ncbi:hypothetical protein GUJ93_ZPchr0008g11792 [Zizania palustris]|uniref:Uncharacterized protein n=1 Tax=Zizania palustris TaxID=103762 RepID=A0A8J5RTA0_ZIZPA|nr:hypothetical protein GUJ93_ZPchr0008g11792 [Zizania palustris]